MNADPDLFAWNFFARWWDCISEMLDMSRGDSLPGILADRWSYVDLYETEDTVIAATQQQAEEEFRHRYPWIHHFHLALAGPHRPAPVKKPRRRKSPPIDDQKSTIGNHQS